MSHPPAHIAPIYELTRSWCADAVSRRWSSASGDTGQPSSRLTISHSVFSSESTIDTPVSPDREAAVEAQLQQDRDESATADYLCYVSQSVPPSSPLLCELFDR